MPSTIAITGTLREAGLRLLSTLADRADIYATDEAGYHILQTWASVLSREPEAISAALIAAQHELRRRDPANARWLDAFDELLTHGGEATSDFAENLWRTYLLHLDSAAGMLWDQYRELQRDVMIETGRSLPQSWSEWLNFIQAFMGLFETYLVEENSLFQDLLLCEEARILADVTTVGLESVVPDRPPIAFDAAQFDFAAALTAYLEWCIARVGRIDLHGYQRSISPTLPLGDVFVPLSLIPLDARPASARYVRHQTLPPWDEELHPFQTPLNRWELDEHKAIPVTDALRASNQLLLLGEAGAGKTTMLHHLALEHARIVLEDLPVGGGNAQAAIQASHRIPLYVCLSDYVERHQEEETLTDYILRTTTNALRDPYTSALITSLLENGQCLVLLDGLDEVTRDQQRQMLVNNICTFTERWSEHGNHVIVSCRFEGYHAAMLPTSFTGYIIRPPDRSQIGLFLLKWSLTLERARRPLASDEEASRRAQTQTLGLLREIMSNPQLHTLARNPLILRMLLSIHHAGLRLPAQRVVLYEHVADALIHQWGLPQRAGHAPQVLEREALLLLGELAYWLQSNRPTGTATEQELRDILGRVWKEQHPGATPEDVQEAIEAFLAEVRHHGGMLAEIEPRQYSFVYHALQEYFAARNLVSSFRTAARRIRTHLHDPRWEEVITLAIGFVSQSSPADAAELVEVAILAHGERAARLGYEPSPYEDVLKRDLFFAAGLLGNEVDVGPEVTQWVVDELIALWLRSDQHDVGRFRLIADSARRHLVNLDGTLAGQRAFQNILNHLKIDDESTRAYAIDALTFWPTYQEDACEALAEISPQTAPPLVKLATAHALGRVQTLSSRAYVLLLSLVRDADPRVREAAYSVLELAQPVPETALRTWVELLRDENPTKRRLGARVLQGIRTLPPLVIGELLHLLSDPNAEVRQSVATALSNAANLPDNALTAICRAIADTSEEVQLAAIEALSRPVTLPQEVVDHLVLWTQDTRPSIRRAAANALGTCVNDADDIRRALERLIGDSSENVRQVAVEMLACKGAEDPRIVHILTHVVDDSVHSVRISLARSLRHFKRPDAQIRETTLRLLGDYHLGVREAILASIAEMETPSEEIVRHLTGLARSSDKVIAEQVLSTLAALRQLPPETLITMIEALPTVQPELAEAIIDCLRIHIPTEAVEIAYPLLDLALGAPDHLRPLVIDVLGMTVHVAAGILEVLMQLVDNDHIATQRAAIATLAQAHQLPSRIITDLFRFLESEHREVRLTTAVTLARLVSHLPGVDFSQPQIVELADTLYRLLSEMPRRATWEGGRETQDTVLLALSWVACLLRPGWLQLPA